MHLLLYNSLLQKVCLTDSVTYLLFVFRLHQNVPRPGMVLSSHEMSHLWDSSQISSHFFLIFLHFLSLLSETKWHSWYSLPSLEHLSLHSSRSWHGDVDALGGGGDGLGGGGDGLGGDGLGGGGDGLGGDGLGGGGDGDGGDGLGGDGDGDGTPHSWPTACCWHVSSWPLNHSSRR